MFWITEDIYGKNKSDLDDFNEMNKVDLPI